MIPEKWKKKTNGFTTCIFFDGAILLSPLGHRYALYICWGGGRWGWDCDWLGGVWGVDDPSAVLAGLIFYIVRKSLKTPRVFRDIFYPLFFISTGLCLAKPSTKASDKPSTKASDV